MSRMTSDRPVPAIDPDTAPYWEGARAHRLVVMRCTATGDYIHPPIPGSPATGQDTYEWVDLGSDITGSVYSFTVVRRATMPQFEARVPYVVALVDVDGAARLRIAGNVRCPVDDVHIGQPVRMYWEDLSEQVSLPQWEAIK